MMIFDHSLYGLPTSRSAQAYKVPIFTAEYELNLIPSNLPANQAVVIQLLSIG